MPRRLKAAFPGLAVVVNGGVETHDAALAHLEIFDGAMLGRAAYQTPWLLAGLEQAIFGTIPADRIAAALAYRPYIEEQLAGGVRLHAMTRHIFGLFAGERRRGGRGGATSAKRAPLWTPGSRSTMRRWILSGEDNLIRAA